MTTAATGAMNDQMLSEAVARRRSEALATGTTWMKTKTGYGLEMEEAARHVSTGARLVDQVSFLGAQLMPDGWDADLLAGPMLQRVTAEVDFVDAFCERGAFTGDQTRRVLHAAAAAGLPTKVHGNQRGYGPGVQLAVEFTRRSVGHVNYLDEHDVRALAGSWSGWDAARRAGNTGVVATCLPACDLSTRQPLAPGRELIDSGAVIALASNCNPDTSYTSNMNFVVATAVLRMRLTLAEAVEAATVGGALALGAQDLVGSLEVGKRADVQVQDAPSAAYLAYWPAMDLTHAVYRVRLREV